MDEECCEVVITGDDADRLLGLTRTLVEERLAACGQTVTGVRSIYRWAGEVHDDPEARVALHTRRSLVPAVVERTRATMEAIGKLPVVCGVAPGYIVPRLQALVMNEAARMVEQGIATAEEIDRATRYGLGLRFAAIAP